MTFQVPEPNGFVHGVDSDPDYDSVPGVQPFNIIMAYVNDERTIEDSLAALINPVD